MDIFVKHICAMDLRKAGWLMSRPYLKSEDDIKDWDEVLKVDMSLHSLNPICLHMRTSMAFRELITTHRNHAVWAQTSRVTPIKDMVIPGYIYDYISSEKHQAFVTEKCSLAELPKEEQDNNRLKLRACTLTEYFAMFDIREWVGFLKYLKIYQPQYFEIYGILILIKLGLTESRLNEYQFKPCYTPSKTDKFIEFSSGNTQIDDWTYMRVEIPFALRAQLVRHRYLIIDDELPWMSFEKLETMRLEDNVKMIIIIKSSNLGTLISKRSCWLAQFSLYEDLIMTYLNSNNLKLKDVIPCKGVVKDCTCKGDMKGRIDGNDPGLICPIWQHTDKALDTYEGYIRRYGENKIIQLYRDSIIYDF